jgi:aspartyl-tRNA(Asn)/glutamyl-tRNA(Gln) amidotransferase subunit C
MDHSVIQKVASLARLKVTQEETEAFAPQLSSIIQNFEKISAIPTEGVEPLITPTDMDVIYREDVMETFPAIPEALDQAPEKMGQLFKVPPVV